MGFSAAIIAGTVSLPVIAGLAVAAAATMAVSYGANEIVEGATNIRLGSQGDVNTKSYNQLRDTLFNGNQTAYDIYGAVGMASSIGVIQIAPAMANTGTASRQTIVNNDDLTFSPVNPGPLKDNVASTFSGSTYTQKTLTADTTMYRVYGGNAGKVGSYLSMTEQNGGLQSQLDLALNPQWGNTTVNIATVIVPKGTVIYEGTAGIQEIYDSVGNVIGTLPGGGSQIYIPKVDAGWFY